MSNPLRKVLILPLIALTAISLPITSHSTSGAASSKPAAVVAAKKKVVKKTAAKPHHLTAREAHIARVYTALVKRNQLIAILTYLNAVEVNACGGFDLLSGGLLPSCCTVFHESKGNIFAVEPSHAGAPYGDPGNPWVHASGKWQFMPHTWNWYMGYPYAAAAPALVQNKKAVEVFAGGSGASNWYGDGCYNGR